MRIYQVYDPKLDPLQEEELVRRCQQADPKAQKWVYDHYADGFYRLVFRYIKYQPDSEDILIMAFTKIFNNINQFEYRGEGSLSGWMKKIVVNETLMWLRRRHQFVTIDRVEDVADEADLSQAGKLEAQDIYNLITQLPVGYRTVFNLYVIDGYNHQEIADMLNISESTSRTQLHKAKSSLRKLLDLEGFNYGT